MPLWNLRVSGESVRVKEPVRNKQYETLGPFPVRTQGRASALFIPPGSRGVEDQGLNKCWSLSGTSEATFMDLVSIKGMPSVWHIDGPESREGD